MYVWVVTLEDIESCEIKYVCYNENKADKKWKELINEQIKNLKDMLKDDEFLFDYDKDCSLMAIKMYENLTWDNIKDANYSYYIPIIKKYEVI